MVIVATVSCIYGIGDPSDYHAMILHLRARASAWRSAIIQRLVAMQYTRATTSTSARHLPGARRRDRHLPAENAELAVRIELFDDEIETDAPCSTRSPARQAEVRALHRLSVQPLRDPRATVMQAIEAIKAELRSASTSSARGSWSRRSASSSAPLRPRDDERDGLLQRHRELPRHLSARSGEPPPTLIDYLPQDALFIDESHRHPARSAACTRATARARRTWSATASACRRRWTTGRQVRGVRAPMPQTVFVSATPAKYERASTGQVVEQVVRPTGLIDPMVEVRLAMTQVDDLLSEINAAKNERARAGHHADQAMAEDLTDYLADTASACATCIRTSTPSSASRSSATCAWASSTCWSASTCCAKGLDIPEVSLVAILDADKEGFLRRGASLIQNEDHARNLEVREGGGGARRALRFARARPSAPTSMAAVEQQEEEGRVILFVCTGNICRSPTAEAVARHFRRDRRAGGAESCSTLPARRATTPARQPDPRTQKAQAARLRPLAICCARKLSRAISRV